MLENLAKFKANEKESFLDKIFFYAANYLNNGVDPTN